MKPLILMLALGGCSEHVSMDERLMLLTCYGHCSYSTQALDLEEDADAAP